jgi:plasmid maintenance system antidote protein VapI
MIQPDVLPKAVLETPGEWLTRFLQERQLGQASLARNLGVSAVQVNRWVTEKDPLPSAAILDISNTYSLSPGDTRYLQDIADFKKNKETLAKATERLSNTFPLVVLLEELLLNTAYAIFARTHRYDESGARVRLLRHVRSTHRMLKDLSYSTIR